MEPTTCRDCGEVLENELDVRVIGPLTYCPVCYSDVVRSYAEERSYATDTEPYDGE